MAEEARKIPHEVEFFFETDKDFRTVAANGAWVGTTTRGDISIDFFIEQLDLPKSVKNAVSEDGKLGDEIARTPPEKRLVRRMQMGVLLSPNTAESLANAITKRVTDLAKHREDK